MKRSRFRAIALSAAAIILIVSGQSSAQLKRTITKTDRFDFGAGGTVTITGAPNGAIRVIGTSKNEVVITAQIEIQAASEADLAKLGEMTGFVTNEDVVRTGIISVGAHNKFGQKKLPKNFPKSLLGQPFTINYVINVPH